jgi:hypothetical protein
VRLAAEGRYPPGRRGQLRSQQGEGRFQEGTWSGPGRAPQRGAQGQGRARRRRIEQHDSEVLSREHASGHPGGVSRGGSARPRGRRQHELSATHRAGGVVRPRAGGIAVRDGCRGGPLARHAPSARTGGGRGPRPALGPRGRDLWRRSVPGGAHGRRGGARPSGRRDLPRQEAGYRHAETLRCPRPAGVRNELRASERLDTCAARDIPLHLQRGTDEGRRHQRHAFLQRDRRGSVSRQPVVAARRAAQGVGFQGLRCLRLLRHLGVGVSSRHARSLRREGQEGSPSRIATCTWWNWCGRAR